MFILQRADIFVNLAIMHLRKNIDDNATFLFAKLRNRSTATIFRVYLI